MDDEKEIWEAKLAEERHRELKDCFTNLQTALNEISKGDRSIAEAVKELAGEMQGIKDLIGKIPTPEKPEVNIELRQDETNEKLNKLMEISVELLAEVKKLNERPKPEAFTFKRDQWREVNRINIEYTKQ